MITVIVRCGGCRQPIAVTPRRATIIVPYQGQPPMLRYICPLCDARDVTQIEYELSYEMRLAGAAAQLPGGPIYLEVEVFARSSLDYVNARAAEEIFDV